MQHVCKSVPDKRSDHHSCRPSRPRFPQAVAERKRQWRRLLSAIGTFGGLLSRR